MKKPLHILLLLLLVSTSLSAQLKKDVLWIGNSYIYTNNLPQVAADLALSLGDTLVSGANTIGGYTLNQHSTNSTTLSLINQQAWDFVVLQEQSQLPSFSPNQVASDVYPYADSLTRKIFENDSCTVPLFFMTWGRKNGDASNCANYPPVCTYSGMQQRLRESYLEMGSRYDAEVSPVGAAWKQVRDSFPLIELYNPDESHPSLKGTYLAACVFYSAIFKKSPVNASYPNGISAQEAASLQNVARRVVLDSLSNWYMDTLPPMANFHITTQNGNDIQFLNLSNHANAYHWDFGDGTQDTATSPLHTFPGPGSYLVTLIVSRRCEQDTMTDSVIIQQPVGTTSGHPNANIRAGWNAQENVLLIENPNSAGSYQLSDLQGRILSFGKLQAGQNRLPQGPLPAGIYLLGFPESGKKAIRIFVY